MKQGYYVVSNGKFIRQTSTVEQEQSKAVNIIKCVLIAACIIIALLV